MKKILILGGNGAIGRYMVDYFYERRQEFDIALITADINDAGTDFIEKKVSVPPFGC